MTLNLNLAGKTLWPLPSPELQHGWSTWDKGATPWELLLLTSASTLCLQVQGDLAVAGRDPAAYVCQAVGSVPGYQGGAEGGVEPAQPAGVRDAESRVAGWESETLRPWADLDLGQRSGQGLASGRALPRLGRSLRGLPGRTHVQVS